MAITFQVSRVERATVPVGLRTSAGSAEPRLHRQAVEALGASVAHFVPATEHGLLGTIDEAYSLHYPLVLSPDAIWLAIAQGFAQHVNANAERLRGKFVRHEGQALIRVERHDFVKGSPHNPWPEVFGAFSDAIAEHIGRQRDLVVCDFSTTGPCERAASEIVLLDAMKQYFRYELLTLCGIPEVTLEGTPDDWRNIRRRARALEEYELEWWIQGLGPVLDQLVAAAEGNVDVRFWETLFKHVGGSGGPYVQGWINVFFPYLKVDDEGTLRRNDMVTGWASGFGRDYGGGPNRGMIPSGVSSAPFKWLYLGTDYPMEFLGGFVGIAQDPGTMALRPVIGWAVRDAGTGTPPPEDDESEELPEELRAEPPPGTTVGIALIAGRLLGEGEISKEESRELDRRVARICAEHGVDLARAWVDVARPGKPPVPSPSFRLALGVKVVAASGSHFYFSIEDLRGALDAARAVPEAVWRAIGEVLTGSLDSEPALHLVSASTSMPGELVYGSPAVLRSVPVSQVSPGAPCAVVDVSPEAHRERIEAAREIGVDGSAGRYRIG